MKIELGGGSRNRGDDWLNVDICETADIKHNLDRLPYPFDDDSIDEVYSSHCFEHLKSPIRAMNEVARICKIGATVEILVPHFGSEMCFIQGHTGAFSMQMIRNVCVHFVDESWTGKKKFVLIGHNLQPSEGLEVAKRELPFLAGIDDQTIMKWIQGTCHEIRFIFKVVGK